VPREAWKQQGCRPVLFLLHGASGNCSDWSEHAHRKLQALAQQYQLIIVTPEGGEHGWYLDSPIRPESAYETHLVAEVVKDVIDRLPSSSVRGVAGLSSGGHGAITLALKHPKLFVSASSMSGVLDLTAARSRQALIERLGPFALNAERWRANSAFHLVEQRPELARKLPMLVSVGSADMWAETNRRFHELLRTLNVSHDFEETAGGHDWNYWVRQLPRHAGWHAQKFREAASSTGIELNRCGRAKGTDKTAPLRSPDRSVRNR
jgi:S-formylglutathione hydrolase FrmB